MVISNSIVVYREVQYLVPRCSLCTNDTSNPTSECNFICKRWCYTFFRLECSTWNAEADVNKLRNRLDCNLLLLNITKVQFVELPAYKLCSNLKDTLVLHDRNCPMVFNWNYINNKSGSGNITYLGLIIDKHLKCLP